MTQRRLKIMARCARGRILDVGYACKPNPYLAGDVVGFDIRRVEKPANYRSVVVGDAQNWCFALGSFDTVLAGEVLEHLEDPIGFLRHCYQLVRPGGVLVLSTPNAYYPPLILLNWLMVRKFLYASEHLIEFPPRLLVRILENIGFRDIQLISGGLVVPGLMWEMPTPKAFCLQMIYVANRPSDSRGADSRWQRY